MKYVVCAVFDKKSEVFGAPFYTVAKGQAMRNFQDTVNRNDPNNSLYAHPEDFDLYHLGEFDDSRGLFNCGEPTILMRGREVAVRP